MSAALPRRCFPLPLLVTLLGMSFALHASARGLCQVRPQDEVIEINTRAACASTDPQRLEAALRVSEYVVRDEHGHREWMASDFSRLTSELAADRVTVIYVHGNKINACDARCRGLDVYRRLVSCASSDQAIRFVIWSWPADEMSGFLRDFRVKAARTTPVGWQLAWAINQLPTEAPIGLLGYSYGARIIGGAAHLLAGGQMSGLAIPDLVERPPLRVSFLAAATHAHWFGPGQYHGLAMNQIDQLLLINNKVDPAMKYYKYISQNSRPQPLGLRGPTCLRPADRHRVRCLDASVCVGRTHDLYMYMASSHTMALVWENLTSADKAEHAL